MKNLKITDFLIYLGIRLCRRRPIVKNSCSANYCCMTYDIYIAKNIVNTKTKLKHEQTDVLLYVNDGVA